MNMNSELLTIIYMASNDIYSASRGELNRFEDLITYQKNMEVEHKHKAEFNPKIFDVNKEFVSLKENITPDNLKEYAEVMTDKHNLIVLKAISRAFYRDYSAGNENFARKNNIKFEKEREEFNSQRFTEILEKITNK